MFTGIVEATGTLGRRTRRGPGDRLEITTDLGPLELGESICVNGACLTVTEDTERGFCADVSAETNEKTTLGSLAPGARLNLERSLKLGDRLGGHLVSGHVDGVASIESTEMKGDACRVNIAAPGPLLPFIATKGSVALDGVSLTVNGVSGSTFEVMLIPHTMDVTNLALPSPGLRLNLEVDLFARYVARYVAATGGLDAVGGRSEAQRGVESALKRAGFL